MSGWGFLGEVWSCGFEDGMRVVDSLVGGGSLESLFLFEFFFVSCERRAFVRFAGLIWYSRIPKI